MEKWVITGISGCGRSEFLEELHKEGAHRGKDIRIHNLGVAIAEECKKNDIAVVDKRILDLDNSLLRAIRSAALKDVQIQLLSNKAADLHLIGVHATFRWKHKIIGGITYNELKELNPDGFLCIVDNVNEICDRNKNNPKWDISTLLNIQETQDWMVEEDFITKLFANALERPFFQVARKHKISNIADLFFTKKKKIYLSYPITRIKESSPELLDRIRGEYLAKLEELFVVFDPLTIKDMELTFPDAEAAMPQLIGQLTQGAKDTIKRRTIEADFQFIDQSDAVVVLYLTDKVSPGVLAEVYYAHRSEKPVYMALPGSKSPFIEAATEIIADDFPSLIPSLIEFASK